MVTTAAVAAVASIIAVTSAVTSLPQTVTNGASVLGTLSAPNLSTTGVDGIVSWGANTVSNYNPYASDFNSGRRGPTYNFDIARGQISPDGVSRSVILINGAFPGPTIEANWGDTITVNVCNNITGPEEGTTLHWHGILQKTTPWYDGVPANTQCPIAPGACMTYSFLADVYGTSWYHSHYTAQYSAGVAGAMIIHGPSQVAYDHDVGPILLSDWYHSSYEQLVADLFALPPGPPPFSDSNLINGKMNYDCSQLLTKSQPCISTAGLSKFRFQSGKKYRLRLINSGAEGMQRFTIDGHNMTIFANDFVPVVPYTTNVVNLGVGQRTDVIVTATGAPNSTFWMRSDLSPHCDLPNNPYALAAIYYEDADTNSVPQTAKTPYDDSTCGNDDLSLTTPYYNYEGIANPAVTVVLNITGHTNGSGVFLWYVNNQTFRADYNAPILPLAIAGNFSYPNPDWQVFNFGTNSSVRLVVYNYFAASHPMHLHGHNFNVLAQGTGIWDGVITNPQNTQRRDTQMLADAIPATATTPLVPAHIVLQYDTDNPGSWPFHCHIAWHVSGGLYINTIEQDARLEQRVLPPVVANTCKAWDAYTASNVVDEIDSGEKRMFARDFSLT